MYLVEEGALVGFLVAGILILAQEELLKRWLYFGGCQQSHVRNREFKSHRPSI